MHFHQQKIKPCIVEYLRGKIKIFERIRQSITRENWAVTDMTMHENTKSLDNTRKNGSPASDETQQTPAGPIQDISELTVPSDVGLLAEDDWSDSDVEPTRYSVDERRAWGERSAREGGEFIDSLLKELPGSDDAEEMLCLLTMKKFQFELGLVTYDWRPGLKADVLIFLPENPAECTGWQKQLFDKVSPLPEEMEYGNFWRRKS